MNDTNERSVASAGSVETKRERFDLYGSVAHAHNLAAYVLAAKAAQECEAEIARLRLTDAEREAIEVAARFMDKWGGVPNTIASDTLRGLLERHAGGPEREQPSRNEGAMPARGGETGDDSPDRA